MAGRAGLTFRAGRVNFEQGIYMKNKWLAVAPLSVCIVLTPQLLPAQTQTVATAASATNAPSPVDHALGLLKASCDKIAAAKAFTFKTHSMVEVPSPVGGQLINYFFVSEVGVQRPNKLFSKKTGDGPAFNVYYNGKTFSAVDEKLGLYAHIDAPPTLDELIPFVMDRTGIYFPCADILYSNPYEKLTNGLTYAYWVGKSEVGGIECDHLAFSGPGIDWQIWVGPQQDPLPRRLSVTLTSEERQPRFLVGFSEWDLKSSLPAKDFEFTAPKKLKEIEFRPQTITTNATK